MTRIDPRTRSARRLSRLLAVQALYQWLMTGQDLGAIESFSRESEDYAECDSAYFQSCFLGAARNAELLRDRFLSLLDRPLNQISPVEHAILLLASHELIDHPEVPYRVVINEAVELAKSLGGNEGHRYINGVLDRLWGSLRPHEPPAHGRI